MACAGDVGIPAGELELEQVHIAQAAALDDVASLDMEIVMTHHVADHELLACLLKGIEELFALLGRQGDGLFHKDMTLVLQCQHGLLIVAEHGGCNVHRITVHSLEHLSRIGEMMGNPILLCHRLCHGGNGIHDGNDFVLGV